MVIKKVKNVRVKISKKFLNKTNQKIKIRNKTKAKVKNNF